MGCAGSSQAAEGGRTCPPPLFPPHSSRFRDACQEGRAECYTTVTILYVQSLAGQHPDSPSDSNQPANPASQPGVPVCTSSARDAYLITKKLEFKHGGHETQFVGTICQNTSTQPVWQPPADHTWQRDQARPSHHATPPPHQHQQRRPGQATKDIERGRARPDGRADEYGTLQAPGSSTDLALACDGL